MLVKPGLCYGRLDLPLRAKADRDIAAVVVRLGNFTPDSIRTSPALRCRLLADAIAAARGGAVVEDARLAELDFGEWEGMAWDDVPRAALDRWAADLTGFAPPGGESGAALVARCRAAYAALPPTGCHAIVSHGGPLRVLGALAAGTAVDLGVAAQAQGEVRVFAGAAPPRDARRASGAAGPS